MKKVITVIIAFALISWSANAQAPNWQWAKRAGGVSGSTDVGNSIAVDGNGNSYVTGHFQYSSIIFGTDTLTNAGGSDMLFVVKYDASGNVVWAKSAGGFGISIAVDGNGNSYVTGHFQSSSITFGTDTLTNAGGSDMFVVKYDASGNVVWAKSAVGNGDDSGNGIALDGNGNTYVTGNFFSSSITFGSTTLTNAGAGWDDMYIVKYDASGNVVWAKSAGGTVNDGGSGIALDGIGNSYVTGIFNSPSITFGSTTLTNAGDYDMFIVKYDTSGAVVWAKSAGGSWREASTGIAVDASGNSYVTGYFASPSITFGSTTLTGTGTNDMFIVKYDASGAMVWAKSTGTISVNQGSITVDGSGNSYVTGNFQSSSITFGTYTLTNAGGEDVFIVKYDASGNAIWAKSSGGSSNDNGNGIAVDGSGNIYVTGSFESSSITFGSATLTKAGSGDIFIAKIKENCFAHYTTAYDSTQNNFTLTVDSVTSFLATSYHWNFGDGTTSILTNPTHIYTRDSLYNVCMKIYTASGDSCEYCHLIGKDSLGNIVRTMGFTLNVQNNTTLNIPHLEKETDITISPNPFTSQTTISFNETQKNTTIKIMDVVGKEIKTVLFSGKSLILEKGEMQSGVYFVQITTSAGSVNEKVVNKKVVVE